MRRSNTALIKLAILTMSFVQMGTNGMAPILAQIAEAFPEAPAARVQFLMTFPSVFCMIFTLSTTLLSRLLPRRVQAVAGLSLVALTGLAAWLFHGSLGILFLWAGTLGVGCGLVAPIAPALVNELFENGERRTMLGWQNAASNIGSMLMTFLGGFLALLGWNWGYLVYLLGLPGIVFTLLALPGAKPPLKGEVAERSEVGGVSTQGAEGTPQSPAATAPLAGELMASRPPFRFVVWREALTAIGFLVLYSAVPANIAMLAEEKALGGTSLSGTLSTVFLLAGILSGLVFGWISALLKRFTALAGVVCLGLGALLIGLGGSLAPVAAGCAVAGFSISLIMPSCMSAGARLPGWETVNTSLILGLAYIGIFVAPLITSLSAALTGSANAAPRFLVIAAASVLLSLAVLVLRPGEASGSKAA